MSREKTKFLMNSKTINPNVLPSFFRDVKIIGTAETQIPKYREIHKELMATLPSQVDCPVILETSPTLLATDQVKSIYQNSDFAGIKNLEAQAQNDLQSIYSNIAQYPQQAWTLVESQGKQFYMSWSNTGSMWAYTSSMLSSDGTSYQAIVQIGSYSASTGIAGIHAYNLTLPTLVGEAVIALVVAIALSGIVAEGLGFLVAGFSILLAQAAASLGLEAFAFSISTFAIASIAFALVFVIVFIGLAFLWNWINRKYTIRLQVFNWDQNNTYSCKNYYGSNTTIPGQDNDTVNFTLPPMVPAGSVVVPPGFQPVQNLDAVCYYAIIIWQNDQTVFEGLSMALAIQQGTSNNGVTWAFDCPRFSDNQQAAVGQMADPQTFLANAPWNPNPQAFSINTGNIPVAITLDALSGADDSLYNAIININYPS
jgi:hypothetical protein